MALKTKPIKTDLFKFVTIRTPKLIDEQKKDVGFIFHDDSVRNTGTTSSSSKIVKTVTSSTNLKVARDIVETNIKTYPYAKTYLDIKNINPEMYNFSSWLMNNRDLFNEDVPVRVAIGTPPPVSKIILTKTQENKIWDNLYYQTKKRKSSYVRQACIQMLVAHNYLNKVYVYDASKCNFSIEKYKRILAFAKVVIDKAFTTKEIGTSKVVGLSRVQKKQIQKTFKTFDANKDAYRYKNLLDEIVDLENTYTKDYHKAYDIERKEYELSIKPLIEDAKTIQKREQETENSLATNEQREAKEIPIELDLPKFEFTFDNHFSDKYIEKLSDSAKSFFIKHHINEGDSFEKTFEVIRNESNKTSKIIFNNSKNSKKKVIVNGISINTKKRNVLDSYSFYVSGKSTDSKLDSIKLLINIGASRASIKSASYSLTQEGERTIIASLTPEIFLEDGNEIYVNLFTDQTLSIDGEHTLSGDLVLTDGTEIAFTTTINGSSDTFSELGVATVDNTIIQKQTELYGVGKIGIADFRKVEQDVCCYVAGEVSHIENILAREHKMRETRRLISSESTTEETKEAEIENLTDSTTNERNEMQTEVSSVLNKDKSQAYGASAGVSGGGSLFKFNANAYADFANSSSSSESNSQAQSYAQEVTERTLERVVQKTSSKRTSRILREFEDRNTHSFDNRKGENHVSGVYRWIDIIYKNQLINYGKRMMYEFMIPEPSRFFKDAIILDSKDNSNNSCNIEVLDEPLHPSELSIPINGAGDLLMDNYLQIASLYNADVKLKPNDTIYIGKSFSYTTPETDDREWDEITAGSADLKIPDGYITASAKVKHKFSDESDIATDGETEEGLHHFVLVGGKLINPDSEADCEINAFIENIPVSYSNLGHHSGNVSISIKCTLTTGAEQQWQIETYNSIMEAYNSKLEAYKNSVLESCMNEQFEEKEEMRFSNSLNRTLEKREIKRICIEMLAKPFGNVMGQDNYTVDGATDLPIVNKIPAFENHAAHVKFFEQAFDWEIMAYLFYPYYWAKDSDWKSLFQETSKADPIFQAFLQSGMARAVVPVRPGFEDAVNYYIKTGDIWNGGGLVIDSDDDLYVSIADEMQTIEGVVEKEWETRVPTSLTMLQKDTVGLDEEGLPCCDFALNDGDNPPFDNAITNKPKEDVQLTGNCNEEETPTP